MAKQLNRIFGGEREPANDFVANAFYDWSTNPFVRGGYMCVLPKAQRDILYGFRHPRIVFAGESYGSSFSSVGGSYSLSLSCLCTKGDISGFGVITESNQTGEGVLFKCENVIAMNSLDSNFSMRSFRILIMCRITRSETEVSTRDCVLNSVMVRKVAFIQERFSSEKDLEEGLAQEIER